MNTRKLGRTDLHLSELGLNATQFGWIHEETSSFALLDAYYFSGGRFIQTLGFSTNSIAAPVLESSSADIVGRWREARGINRDDLVLSSRINFFRPAHGGSAAFINLIRDASERSLRQLRTNHLDLLICDWDDQLLPMDDILEAIDMLTRAGLVRYAVAGDFPPWRLVDSVHRSGLRRHVRFEALQAEYSLMRRDRFEPEAMAMCREHRLGFIARAPLAGGFLAQRTGSGYDAIRREHGWQSERFGSNTGDAVLKVLSEVADKRLATPAQIALAWVLRNPQVTSALISAPAPRELRELVRAADITLTAEQVGALANASTVKDRLMELRHV